MARIMGVDLPRKKMVETGLTYIYGIGPTSARKILQIAGVDGAVRVDDLTEKDVSALTAVIQRDYRVEGDLRRQVNGDIKRLMEIQCYRGQRHIRGLPVRGQRTSTNARTRKGPKATKARKKR